MRISQKQGMAREKRFTARLEMRCTPVQRADIMEAIQLLSEDDPKLDFSNWALPLLWKEAKKIIKRSKASVGTKVNEVPSAEPEPSDEKLPEVPKGTGEAKR